MNNLECMMVDVLKDLRDNHGVVGIKAEFEAEGTRLQEALRLKDIISQAGLGLTLKIGGCEAVRDIYEAINIGVERIVAPMVETPYALKKFLNITEKLDLKNESIGCCINIETVSAYNNFENMMADCKIELLAGIVIGRVDLAGSLGLRRDDIEGAVISAIVMDLINKAKQYSLEVILGGGVGAHSISFFQGLNLDRYETRKVIFDYKRAMENNPAQGFNRAIELELMWLENKQNYYINISNEDVDRIAMLRSRIQ